jgi:hypothetical protein
MGGNDIKWNFGKFLISNGAAVKRCAAPRKAPAHAARRGALLGRGARVPGRGARRAGTGAATEHSLYPALFVTMASRRRYEPTTSPKAIQGDIESAINRARLAK